MFFDSHAHLDHRRFDADRDEIFADLKQHNVGYVMDVGCSLLVIFISQSSLNSIHAELQVQDCQ